MRNNFYRNLRRVFYLVLAVVGILVVYWGATGLLEPSMESYVRRSLPEGLETRDVSFQLMPFKINLENSSMESGPGRTTRIEEISVNPQLGSLFGDTFVIDTLEFDGITLTFYRENSPETAPIGGNQALADLQESGPQTAANFRINRIRMTNARVLLMDNPENREPLLNLSPVRSEFGPITPNSLEKGLDVDVTSGLWGEGEHLHLRTTIRYDGNLDAEGTLRVRETPLDLFHPELIPGLRLTEGSLDGDASFTAGTDSFRVSSLNLHVRNSRVTYRQPPPTPPAVAPVDTGTKTASDTATAEDPFRTIVEDVQVEIVETRLYLPALSGRGFHVEEGLLKAGPYQPEPASMPAVGQLLFREPAGLFEFKSDLDLSGDVWELASVLSNFRVDNVNELDPYLGNLLPVRFQSGRLIGGIRGSMSSEALDLAVELDFDQLKIRRGRNESSSFLGVPVNVYLNYLSKNDGELNLSFQVTGSPSSPSIEISKLRTRLITNLGIDAAVIGAFGLPVFVGDKVMERFTGFSVISEARNTLSGFFESPEEAEDGPVLKKERLDTPVPSR